MNMQHVWHDTMLYHFKDKSWLRQVSFNAAGGACIRDNAWHVAESLFGELGKVPRATWVLEFTFPEEIEKCI